MLGDGGMVGWLVVCMYVYVCMYYCIKEASTQLMGATRFLEAR